MLISAPTDTELNGMCGALIGIMHGKEGYWEGIAVLLKCSEECLEAELMYGEQLVAMSLHSFSSQYPQSANICKLLKQS